MNRIDFVPAVFIRLPRDFSCFKSPAHFFDDLGTYRPPPPSHTYAHFPMLRQTSRHYIPAIKWKKKKAKCPTWNELQSYDCVVVTAGPSEGRRRHLYNPTDVKQISNIFLLFSLVAPASLLLSACGWACLFSWVGVAITRGNNGQHLYLYLWKDLREISLSTPESLSKDEPRPRRKKTKFCFSARARTAAENKRKTKKIL